MEQCSRLKQRILKPTTVLIILFVILSGFIILIINPPLVSRFQKEPSYNNEYCDQVTPIKQNSNFQLNEFTQLGLAFSNNPFTASTPIPSIAYAFHEHIYVRSNAELEAVASSGTGTALDPYLIEELNITTPFHEGILIRDTTKHFIIKICLFDAEYGISISAIT